MTSDLMSSYSVISPSTLSIKNHHTHLIQLSHSLRCSEEAVANWQDVQKKQQQIGERRSKNSRLRKCTVIWLDELASFLQHQLLKGSNCSNAHMHLEYYYTCIYRANLIVSIFL